MTTIATTSPPLSEQDLARLADEPGIEYAGGRVVEKEMGIGSSAIEIAVSAALFVEAAKTGEARVFSQSANYRCFADDPVKFRKPDVSVVRAERLKGVDFDAGFLHFPADLVVEVLSPNDFAIDVAMKVEEYLANGFPLLWIVNPASQTVTVYRADGSVALLHAGDEITGEAALPSFRCKVGQFFAKPA
jgi:Uma2 family endonuclease